ncbi:AMP-binding protein [Actinomadura rugatobispora]|uniref:AMP-binding protein n=1 Tax=Actinomadura rugatobispora TaxID=1994 RepID=A0ABW0ZWQ3_9ACTN
MYFAQLQTVASAIRFHAGRIGDQPAIVCAGRSLGYARLYGEACRVAHALRAEGVPEQGRVAYLGKESVHYYEVFFGCALSGTVLVPINWRLTPVEVEHVLRDSDSEVLVVDRDLLKAAAEVVSASPRLRAVVVLDAGAAGDTVVTGGRAIRGSSPTPRTRSCSSTPAGRPGCPRASCWRSAACSRSGTRWPRRAWTGSTGAPGT